jgi:hypothetical protein
MQIKTNVIHRCIHVFMYSTLIISVFKLNRKRSKKIYSSQMTMLHLTCRYDPPSDIIELLLQANPKATMAKSLPYGEIPLHFATGRNMASTDVIKQLVKVNPKGVSTLVS